MAEISSNKKIAKNTFFLYFRMMFIMIVSLYTSRVNLSVLGIEDNGIYQVVGGLVTVFAFLNGSLAGATSRFISYDLGRDDLYKLQQTFSASLQIHFFISLLIIFLAETIGLWFLKHHLVIPSDKLFAAELVYQFSILSCVLSILLIPYNALIIAHEKMKVFAYMGIVDVVLKLLVCFSLYIIPYNKLASYGVLIFGVSLINLCIYYLYCKRNFIETKYKWISHFNILKPILSFSGWDLFGNFSVMARSQGINIILNMFFGPAINSAAGFASSIGNAVYSFANNFMTAIKPPIVKAYSQGNIAIMQSLMINASKYSFCLLLLLSLPFFFESSYIVKIWLKTPPEYTNIFCVLDLFLSLFSSLFLPLVFAIHATGKIKFMSIVNGSIWFLSLPLTYLFLYLGFNPTIPYIIKIVLLIPVVISNIYNLSKLIPNFKIKIYLLKAVLPSLCVFIIVVPLTFIIHKLITVNELLRFIVTCISAVIFIIVTAYSFILTKEHRTQLNNKIKYITKW